MKSSDVALLTNPATSGVNWNRCFPAVAIATREAHHVPHCLLNAPVEATQP